MAAINNVATSNGYTAAATLICQPTQRLTVQIFNATVYYQLALNWAGMRPSDVNFNTDEKLLAPAYWTFDDKDFQGQVCTGIRFRSAVTGTPARVSASD